MSAEVEIRSLRPGERFRLAITDANGRVRTVREGSLVFANDCRALVSVGATKVHKSFTDRYGKVIEFEADRSDMLSWAPETLVERLS